MSFGGRLEAFCTVPSSTTISVTNNGGGPTTVSLTAGTYTTTSICAHLQTILTAQRAPSSGSWSVSVSTGSAGTGLVTIAMSAGTFSIAWTSTTLRDLLGFAGDITTETSSTGTSNARGLWLPHCPMTIEGHPTRAPKVTDARSTVSPTGRGLTLKGTSKYRHRGLRWSHVPVEGCYEGSATTPKASLQQWLDDTQFADGHTWFRPGSRFQIYWSNNGTDVIVGADLNAGAGPTYGWTCQPAISTFEPRPSQSQLLHYWVFEIASIESEG